MEKQNWNWGFLAQTEGLADPLDLLFKPDIIIFLFK